MKIKHFFLIEEINIDNYENNVFKAVKYNVCGFVNTEDEAKLICNKSRVYTQNDSWAISEEIKEYKYTEVKYFRKNIE